MPYRSTPLPPTILSFFFIWKRTEMNKKQTWKKSLRRLYLDLSVVDRQYTIHNNIVMLSILSLLLSFLLCGYFFLNQRWLAISREFSKRTSSKFSREKNKKRPSFVNLEHCDNDGRRIAEKSDSVLHCCCKSLAEKMASFSMSWEFVLNDCQNSD